MKDQPIIDFHAHLGDIFKDARNVIYKLGLKPADMPDPFTVREERGFKGPFITEDTDEALREFIDVNHERCRTNTLENMQREMDECGIDHICVLPIRCPPCPSRTTKSPIWSSRGASRSPASTTDSARTPGKSCSKIPKRVPMPSSSTRF